MKNIQAANLVMGRKSYPLVSQTTFSQKIQKNENCGSKLFREQTGTQQKILSSVACILTNQTIKPNELTAILGETVEISNVSV